MTRRLLLLLPLLVLLACRTCPTCPTIAAEPVRPMPTYVEAPRLPCSLPPRPRAFEVVGMPSTEGILVTKTDLAGLLAWLTSTSKWMDAAAVCLAARTNP